jgi:hypothetical protein
MNTIQQVVLRPELKLQVSLAVCIMYLEEKEQEVEHTQSWQSRHGLSSAAFQALFDSLTYQGYRLVDLSGYTSNDKVLLTCLSEHFTSPAWNACFGMTSVEY